MVPFRVAGKPGTAYRIRIPDATLRGWRDGLEPWQRMGEDALPARSLQDRSVSRNPGNLPDVLRLMHRVRRLGEV